MHGAFNCFSTILPRTFGWLLSFQACGNLLKYKFSLLSVALPTNWPLCALHVAIFRASLLLVCSVCLWTLTTYLLHACIEVCVGFLLLLYVFPCPLFFSTISFNFILAMAYSSRLAVVLFDTYLASVPVSSFSHPPFLPRPTILLLHCRM